MVIAGGDICAAALQHKTAKTNAAADLQDALTGDGKPTHLIRQSDPGGPHNAEHGPRRRGNAGSLGAALRVPELLAVAQRADLVIAIADPVRSGLDRITRHANFSCDAFEKDAAAVRGEAFKNVFC